MAARRVFEDLAGDRGLHFFLVDVEVGVNVLDVVVIFEGFDHAHHLLGLRAAELDVILGDESDFRGGWGDACG